jgi:hypothetical protein
MDLFPHGKSLGEQYCPRQLLGLFLHTRRQSNASVFALIEEVHISSYPICPVTTSGVADAEDDQMFFSYSGNLGLKLGSSGAFKSRHSSIADAVL